MYTRKLSSYNLLNTAYYYNKRIIDLCIPHVIMRVNQVLMLRVRCAVAATTIRHHFMTLTLYLKTGLNFSAICLLKVMISYLH